MSPRPFSKISVDHVSHWFPLPGGGKLEVLSDINLEVPAGELVILLGPSGCGKSTLINLLAGFERPSQGRVRMDGVEIAGPSSRRIVLFQEGGLFPWRTALDNVRFGLDSRGLTAEKARTVAREYLALVGLAKYERSFPHELSGGMRQRVALARALAVQPEVLFMDEPFGALDTFTRYRMQDELLRVLDDRAMTVVLVTHDLDEAVYLARRVVLLAAEPGRVATEIDLGALCRPCDRGSPEFAAARATVFQAFAQLDGWRDDNHIPAGGDDQELTAPAAPAPVQRLIGSTGTTG